MYPELPGEEAYVVFVCSKCKESRSPDLFSYNRIGRNSHCNSCRAKDAAAARRAAGAKPKVLSKLTDTTKECTRCKQEKLHNAFSPAKRGSGGLSSVCQECAKAYSRTIDPEIVKARTALYRANNRERYLANHRIVQATRKGRIRVRSDGSVTDERLKSLYSTEACSYCGDLTPEEERTLDHVVALAAGGCHSSDNIVMACRSCNSAKRDLPVEEFLSRLKDKNEQRKTDLGNP